MNLPDVAASLASAANSIPWKWRRFGRDAATSEMGSRPQFVLMLRTQPGVDGTMDSDVRSPEWKRGFRQKAATDGNGRMLDLEYAV